MLMGPSRTLEIIDEAKLLSVVAAVKKLFIIQSSMITISISDCGPRVHPSTPPSPKPLHFIDNSTETYTRPLEKIIRRLL